MIVRLLFLVLFASLTIAAQTPPIEPGVSQELAKWRAAHYSSVRYKLDLTLEKMSPVLRGTIEIRVRLLLMPRSAHDGPIGGSYPIVLDWRKIAGHEKDSSISNVSINGIALIGITDDSNRSEDSRPAFIEDREHLRFGAGVKWGENVIKLDFTSPILTSGSAITRYIDKEDGSEYIYSLFVPSDASTAFPVFDQPDLKARFTINVLTPKDWSVVSNTFRDPPERIKAFEEPYREERQNKVRQDVSWTLFAETKPISTYVFPFAAGPFDEIKEARPRTPAELAEIEKLRSQGVIVDPVVFSKLLAEGPADRSKIYVRKSQAAKFKPHAAEVFRLNREAIKFFEEYFNYKFPFPKYDLVLIPEFPFGGMEHAGATFLRESSIIFPQEPMRNDRISRALLIFHEASHQWFGDTVTMRWFDDLWLKEGFATFTAYKAMEKIMPEMMAWKVFYERVKQAAYQTDSTKGTTPIYQEIKNLSAAKSAYGNIVYRKAPSFLKQAEFYLGPDEFQTAVRAFLKKHEYANAGWEDLVKEFEVASKQDLKEWATAWVKTPGVPIYYSDLKDENYAKNNGYSYGVVQEPPQGVKLIWPTRTKLITRTLSDGRADQNESTLTFGSPNKEFSGRGIACDHCRTFRAVFNFANYQDYGYGIFLLDDKSRDYVLKNIHNEKDAFLRSMMWGSLWDSVREAELDPKVYVELAIKNLPTETDETIVSSILGRVGTAMNYYIESPSASKMLTAPVEMMLIDRMQNAPTAGQRITFYRAFLNAAASEDSRKVLRDVLNLKFEIKDLKLKTKDKFDIVTRLLILGDPDAPRLLAELEKTEASDDAKRYAYAARAGIATAENKAKYWDDFTNNKEISESWIEAAFGPWNSIRHGELTLPYLERALRELPNHKRSRKMFFVNGWLAAFIGGQRSEQALGIVNKFLTDNPNLDNDLRLKILENVDLIERAVKIRSRYAK